MPYENATPTDSIPARARVSRTERLLSLCRFRSSPPIARIRTRAARIRRRPRPTLPAGVFLVAGLLALGTMTGCGPIHGKGTGGATAQSAKAAGRSAGIAVPSPSLPIAEPDTVSTTLLDASDVESGQTFVRFRIADLQDRPRRKIVIAVAVPPGVTPAARIESFRVRQDQPWDTPPLDDRATSNALGGPAAIQTLLQRMVAVADRGIARRTHLFQVSVETDVPASTGTTRYALTEARIAVLWNEPWHPASLDDQVYGDPGGPWLQTLSRLVVNPSALRPYADPAPDLDPTAPAMPDIANPDWQPRPVEGAPADAPWIKILVDEEALYAVDWRALKDSGWNPDSLEPSQIRIFNQGVEIPTLLVGGFAKRFTIQDRVIFRGLPSPSPTTRANAYFIGVAPAGEQPLRFSEPAAPPIPAGEVIAEWPVETRIEQNDILETKEGNFLSIQDMRQVWREVPPDNAPLSIPFDLPGHVAEPSIPIGAPRAETVPDSSSPASPALPKVAATSKNAAATTSTLSPTDCSIRLFFYKGKDRTPPAGTLEATLNGVATASANVSASRADPEIVFQVDSKLLREKGNELTIRWTGSRDMTPIFLDAIVVRHARRLDLSSGSIEINLADRPTSNPITLRVTGVAPPAFLPLDLTRPERPSRLPSTPAPQAAGIDISLPAGDTAGTLGLFSVSAVHPVPAGRVSPWKPWRELDPAADSVIVTHSAFRQSADTLAAAWEREGRHPVVIDVDSLYDAFTVGLLDPAAIRLFLSDAMLRWSRKPEVVLLVGDCTSDFRNRARNQVENYVPSYSHAAKGLANQDHYASDLWFGQLLGDDDFADLLVGRLSVASPEDAETVVQKQIQSRNPPPGVWAQTLGFVADHGNFENVCEELRLDVLPPSVLPRLAYLDREPFEDNFYLPAESLQGDEVKVSPATTRKIQSLFEEGSAIIAFFGHGSPNIWSDQRIWFGGDSPNSDNRRLKNAPRYPLVFNGTCNTGAFDYPTRPWNICISEDMMRQPGGGAFACFVPSAPGFTSNHKILADALFRGAFTFRVRRIGPLCELARMTYQLLETADDHSQMFNILGDPLASLPPAQTVEAPVAIRDGRAILHSVDSNPAPTAERRLLAIGPDGELLCETSELRHSDAAPEVPLPPGFQGRIQLLEYNLSGNSRDTSPVSPRFIGGDAFVGPRAVSVKTVSLYGNPTGKPGTDHEPSFLVTLANQTRYEAESTVAIQTRGTDGEWRTVGSAPFRLPPSATHTLRVEAALSPGLHLIRATVTKSDLVEEAIGNPPQPTVVAIPFPERRRDLALRVLSTTALPGHEGSFALTTQLVAANLGSEPWSGSEFALFPGVDGAPAATTPTAIMVRPNTSPIKPGEFTIVSFANAPANVNETQTWRIVPKSSMPDWHDEDPANDTALVAFDPASLPELAFVPGSLSQIPATPTEGETVFLRAVVQNRGPVASSEFTVKGIAIDKDGKEVSMPDRANSSLPRQPPLAPGETREIEVRWDPTRNLDTQSIALVAEHTQRAAELDPANNRIEAPIRVLSKWKLVPLGIAIRDRQTDSAILVARIRNDGETPARFVEVAFYPDDDHSKENRLGVTLKDVIEPGQTAEFEYLWRVRPEDVGRKVQPSFEAYIKGSMLRVAGTGAE